MRWCSFILFASLGTLLHFASAATDFSVGIVQGDQGATLIVPITFSGSDGSVGIQFDVLYDGVIFDSDPAVAGAAAGSHVVVSNQLGDGHRRVIIYSASNAVVSNGTLVEIPFELEPGRTGGISVVNLSDVLVADALGDPISPLSVTPGSVEELKKRPTLSEIAILETGAFRMQFFGMDGVNYRIEVSVNLVQWEILGTATVAGGLLVFSDPAASSFDRRFYRAVEL